MRESLLDALWFSVNDPDRDFPFALENDRDPRLFCRNDFCVGDGGLAGNAVDGVVHKCLAFEEQEAEGTTVEFRLAIREHLGPFAPSFLHSFQDSQVDRFFSDKGFGAGLANEEDPESLPVLARFVLELYGDVV